MGVFDKIAGLIMGRVEMSDNEGAPFSLDELLIEIVGERKYPILSEFDCSHTIPMHSIGERTKVSLECSEDGIATFKLLEAFVA